MKRRSQYLCNHLLCANDTRTIMYKQNYSYEPLFSAGGSCDNCKLSILRVVLRFTTAYNRSDRRYRKPLQLRLCILKG